MHVRAVGYTRQSCGRWAVVAGVAVGLVAIMDTLISRSKVKMGYLLNIVVVVGSLFVEGGKMLRFQLALAG